MQEAVIGGFSHPTQGELLAPYVARYFAEVGTSGSRRTSELAQNIVVGLFPTRTRRSHGRSTAADAFLADPDLPPALRRLVGEGRADMVRALRGRSRDGAG